MRSSIAWVSGAGVVAGSKWQLNDEGERVRYAGYAVNLRTAEAMTIRAHTIRSTACINRVLEWIAYDLTRRRTAGMEVARAGSSRSGTRIELFDCVWWIYLRRLEPVPSTMQAATPAGA